MRTDYLNPQLYNRLYAYMTYDNVLALRVSLETGLRIDDVLALRSEQLHGRTLRGVAEKTGKPYRKVISADLAKQLRLCGNCEYFFPHRTKHGAHRTRQAVWANMKQAAKRIGVELNAAPHSARKTYAVETFKDGGLPAVQRELQHDRISTTMLYAFSDMLHNGGRPAQLQDCGDLEQLAELIAEKVAVKIYHLLDKNKTPC